MNPKEFMIKWAMNRSDICTLSEKKCKCDNLFYSYDGMDICFSCMKIINDGGVVIGILEADSLLHIAYKKAEKILKLKVINEII